MTILIDVNLADALLDKKEIAIKVVMNRIKPNTYGNTYGRLQTKILEEERNYNRGNAKMKRK